MARLFSIPTTIWESLDEDSIFEAISTDTVVEYARSQKPRRGDIFALESQISATKISTHQVDDFQGCLIWDGEQLQDLDFITVEIGTVPVEFLVPDEFPPDHWSCILGSHTPFNSNRFLKSMTANVSHILELETNLGEKIQYVKTHFVCKRKTYNVLVYWTSEYTTKTMQDVIWDLESDKYTHKPDYEISINADLYLHLYF